MTFEILLLQALQRVVGVLLLPPDVEVGEVEELIAVLVDEELGGAACATEGAIALAAYLVLEVEPGTALGYEPRGDNGDVIETEWGEALHLDVVDGGGCCAPAWSDSRCQDSGD